jgi:hypothetical protein
MQFQAQAFGQSVSAMADTGAGAEFITEAAVARLGVKVTPSKQRVCLGDKSETETIGVCEVPLRIQGYRARVKMCLRIAYSRQGRVHPPSPKPEAERKTASWKSKQQGHERNWQSTRQRKEPEKTKRGRKERGRELQTKRRLEKEETPELTQSARSTDQPRVCSKTDTSKADEKEQQNVRSWAR